MALMGDKELSDHEDELSDSFGTDEDSIHENTTNDEADNSESAQAVNLAIENSKKQK